MDCGKKTANQVTENKLISNVYKKIHTIAKTSNNSII